jgi:hypothetical protein
VTIWVVMGNDYPDSVWSSERAAEAAVGRAKAQDKRLRPGKPPIQFKAYPFQLNKDPWP